jgi:uncharacterized NAD(P)/FAD-binding protein YdhS
MKYTIVVVGSGATALSLLRSFYDECMRSLVSKPLTIYVVERRRYKGRGLAYDVDVSTNLLNTRAGFITPFIDKPGHFYEWLASNRELWEDEFPNLEISVDTFVPRSLFGLYLEYMMSDLAGMFAAIGVELVQVRGEVTSLDKDPRGKVNLITDSGLKITADHVAMCCGNLQSKEYSALETHAGFHPTPYPIGRLARTARSKASVAILGARLSAIDAALGLVGCGFQGQITLYSRSGYFPSVRGTQGRYTPSILTLNRLRRHFERHGPIRLPLVLKWMVQELEIAGCPVVNIERLPPAAPVDVIAFLENEIAAAASPRPWQAVLYATNSVIDYLWQILHDDDRATFMSRYAAAWMSYRVSIPTENASRLVELARQGRLLFRRGPASVAPVAGGGFSITNNRGADSCSVENFDMVVAAFGTPRDAKQLNSILIQSILKSGLAQAHRYGGLVVDPGTNALIDSFGSSSDHILVLGELTSGVHFFTSVLEVNARHAARLAKRIFAQTTHGASTPISLPALVPPSLPLGFYGKTQPATFQKSDLFREQKSAT